MIGLFATALAAGLNMPCEQLTSVKLERASITAATTVAEGIFTPPPSGGPPPPANAPPPEPIPEHCKVTMVLKPTSDSNINAELWLPTEELERQVPGCRQRRVGPASIQGYGRHASSAAPRLCDRRHRHGSLGGRWPQRACSRSAIPRRSSTSRIRAMHEMTVKSKYVDRVVLQRAAATTRTTRAARPAAARA